MLDIPSLAFHYSCGLRHPWWVAAEDVPRTREPMAKFLNASQGRPVVNDVKRGTPNAPARLS